ncbi:BTAD domain-containing putative transcriptional regulator [Nostocoides australiense]|nr:BTAD domain-containing putative transcriptional regulator [Tetrasphaera australiensis]
MTRVTAFMVRVDYRVLGALQAGPDAAVLRGQRARDVLALLLMRRGRPVTPDAILDAVWGADAHTLDTSVVHTVIARLRRALGPHAIHRHDAGYQLHPRATLDADEFTRLISAARALVPDRRREIIELLQQALLLWSGPEAFGGVSDELVAGARPRLHELRDAAVEELAERLLAGGTVGELTDAVLALQDLAEREPLRERAHELLMEGLYRLGRQGEALTVYDRLRRGLRDELGIDPGPATAAMQVRILNQDPSVGPAPRSVPPPRGVVPRPRTRTIGREAELRQLADLAEAGRRLITIVGPGGVGKSRLLIEYAHTLPADARLVYAELPCGADVSAAEVAETIARAAGLTLGGGDPVDTLVTALRDSEEIVLLDEAEWSVAATATLIERLLSDGAGPRIVLTSRVPLGLVGESQLPLAPLAAPAPGATPDGVSVSPAVQLFVERLGDHLPGLRLSEGDYARAAEITRRVDGLPLALEIVAGQSIASSVTELLSLVESPLDIEAVERDRTARQRTLRETLAWSVDRLPEASRIVLRRLAVFSGTFDMAAAEAIVGHVPTIAAADIPAAIRTLIREAQIQVVRRGGQARMRILRPSRAFLMEHLSEADETEDTMRRYRGWYAARWRDQLLTDALIKEVATSYPDYHSALRDALRLRDAETLGDLAIVLCRYWFFVETGSEGVRLVRAALATGVLSPRHTAILRLLEAALLPQDQGLEQRSVLDDLVPDLADDADWLGRLHILRSVGPYVHGDFPRALECAQEAVAHAQAQAEHHVPEALGAYAVMLAALGRATEAVAAGQEAWRLIAAAPSAVDLTQVVPKVALALIDSDHPREALEILDRALAQVEEELGLAPPSLFTTNAGWAALGSGDPGSALLRFAQSLDQLAGGGDLLVTGEVLSGAGAAMAALSSDGAADVLDLADEHLRVAGAVLTPWQAAVVERHRAALPARAKSGLVLGPDFARGSMLIRHAADQHRSG